MLQVKNIKKEYHTGSLVQKALDDVSLNLRDNEFVAILGPSGSGKTTLLNIIGGLDQYDSGDLIINGISTKEYTDRDWDSYRNHTVGFVFQSYNLIPHQTLLSNVELALTISGIGKAERRRRAREALEKVGLGDQVEKRPAQLSGGQMQRVAIARALVNDPDILLADEPTGALDSVTSVQVMDLLQEVANDRLVVMVTHNPELAQTYATRIVQLADGKILSDTDPYLIDEEASSEPVNKNMGKSSMNFGTALSLSFNNLRTKKARTILTAFAGSIGIIGIALILALSTGVNNYIASIEEDTLTGYPLQITNTGFDWTSLLVSSSSSDSSEDEGNEINVAGMLTSMFSKMEANDLAGLKEYLDSGESGIEDYIKAIEYSYDIVPQIYRTDGETIRQVNPDSTFSSLGFGSTASASSLLSSMMSTDVFYQLPETESLYLDDYDVMAGRWPESYDEVVLVLNSDGSISDFLLYTLGLRDAVELDEMIQQFIDGEDITTPKNIGSYTYDDILGITFKLVNVADYYEYDSDYQVWTDKSGNSEYMKELVNNGEDITIVGIVQLAENSGSSILSSGVYYLPELVSHVVEMAAESDIVQQQLANPDVNVFTGETFGEESTESYLDLQSLISIDEDAMADAFTIDTEAAESSLALDTDSMQETFLGAMDLDSIELSDSVDISDVSVSLPDVQDADLSELIGSVAIDTSALDLNALTASLMDGYQAYVLESTGMDTASMTDYFTEYLSSEAAQQIISETVMEVIAESGGVTVTTDAVNELMTDLLSGYLNYIT
ncbi:MAG: ABC transporter ATP-binding protein, partial [Clostridiales bacterium]|nr:ABC transporter ATP-binding protein [Clostridiales bacterium]